MATKSIQHISILLLSFFFCQQLSAHNGSVAYAYPLGKITVDGNFSDWPKDAMRYMINMNLSDTKPKDNVDFSGFFQVGYRLDNRSLYIAFTITDDNFLEDTSQKVRWNTQDGLELSLDARHLLSGSGVASFMYSKKLRNTNNAFYDPFAKKASWEIMEVGFATKGTTRFYEWRIILGDEMTVGKSVGFDFHVFDKDDDGSFSYSAWGSGSMKYMNPKSLGDVILLPANAKLATIAGNVSWDKPMKVSLPGEVRLRGLQNSKLWLEAAVDSTGNYSVKVPPGSYEITLPDAYLHDKDKVYATAQKNL
jgi:hypothetical protein